MITIEDLYDWMEKNDDEDIIIDGRVQFSDELEEKLLVKLNSVLIKRFNSSKYFSMDELYESMGMSDDPEAFYEILLNSFVEFINENDLKLP